MMEWLKAKLRAWLGIADDWEATCLTVRGLRTDHEALVSAFHDGQKRHRDAEQLQGKMNEQIVGTLNRTTVVAASLDRRVGLYERSVPQLKRARAALDAADEKARKKAAKEARALAVVSDDQHEDAVDAQREAGAGVADA